VREGCVALQRLRQDSQLRRAHPEQLPTVPSQPAQRILYQRGTEDSTAAQPAYSMLESVELAVSALAIAATPSLARKQCANLAKQR
jgi:hypothetical protein